MKRRITMDDIAKKLNVSISSVSIALNNKPGITEGLRRDVLKVCAEMGYDVERITHKGSVGGNIGFLGMEDFFVKGESFYTRMMHEAQEEAEKRNYHLIINSMSKDEIEKFTLPHFMKMDVKGIIIAGYMPKEYIVFLKQKEIPLVLLGYDVIDPVIDCIDCDNLMGAYNAVNYLISRGHRSIGLIGGVTSHISPLLRIEGYRMALRMSGLPVNEEIIVENLPRSSIEQGHKATLEILENYKGDIDAFFCVTDNYATGCMKAIHQMGYKIPDDISVMGFDNMDWVAHLTPALTTVSIPTSFMGKAGMRRLLRLVEAKDRFINERPQKIFYPGEIIVRESVADANLVAAQSRI